MAIFPCQVFIQDDVQLSTVLYAYIKWKRFSKQMVQSSSYLFPGPALAYLAPLGKVKILHTHPPLPPPISLPPSHPSVQSIITYYRASSICQSGVSCTPRRNHISIPLTHIGAR